MRLRGLMLPSELTPSNIIVFSTLFTVSCIILFVYIKCSVRRSLKAHESNMLLLVCVIAGVFDYTLVCDRVVYSILCCGSSVGLTYAFFNDIIRKDRHLVEKEVAPIVISLICTFVLSPILLPLALSTWYFEIDSHLKSQRAR